MKATITFILGLAFLLMPITSAFAYGGGGNGSSNAVAQQQAIERFRPKTKLAPGQSVTYYFGSNTPNSATTLSSQRIFDSYNDGLRAVVGDGTTGTVITVLCKDKTGQSELTNIVQHTKQSSVSASVDCASDPESVTLKNNSTLTLKVEFIASVAEPQTFYRADTIEPGSSITYSFGPNAPDSVNTLSRNRVFSDTEDGVQVSLDFIQPPDILHGTTAAMLGVPCNEGSFTDSISRNTKENPLEKLGSFTVKLDCASDTETITIVNNTKVPILSGYFASYVGGSTLPAILGGGGSPPKPKIPDDVPHTGGGGTAMAPSASLPWGGIAGLGALLLLAAAGAGLMRQRKGRSTQESE